MKRKKLLRNDLLSSCHEISPDDGIDPKIYFRKNSERKFNRKALQLCSQVSKALGQALAWEMADDLLNCLMVESVVPAPDSSHLLVTVSLPALPNAENSETVLDRLHRSKGKLRAEVAVAIHRRRVPDLSFRVEVRKEVDQ
jgi:ribosome-binding factor A